MIRIDEIYQNVFGAAIRSRSNISLHWFDPFGSKSFSNLVTCPQHANPSHHIIFWDQEPFYKDDARVFFDSFFANLCFAEPQIIDDSYVTLVTSETLSEDVQWALDTYKINDARYYFFHGWAALDWYRGYNHSYLFQPWADRSFDQMIFCPNNIVGGRRTHRLELLSKMDACGLINKNNMISFPAVCPYENKSVLELLADQGLPPLSTHLPLIIDNQNNHADCSHRIDFWQQAQKTFCHVVTETVYQSDRIHLTEKSFKPIVLQQPFILVSAKGSLAALRSYGFLTFDCLWSEQYDQTDDSDRIGQITKVLETVNNWTLGEIKDAQHTVASIVQHNFEWFYGEFQNILWREMTDLIDRWR